MYPAGQRILVIESDAKCRQAAARILAEEGFTVTGAAEGLSALRALSAGPFALAIIAAGLPGSLDGAATLRHLRLRQPGLKALYTGAPKQRPARLEHDRDEFIAAPFVRRELLGCVFELLQRPAAPAGGTPGLGQIG